jgi:hypothetical protein
MHRRPTWMERQRLNCEGHSFTMQTQPQRYSPDVLHNRAAEAAQSGRLTEAFAYLREASALDPRNVQLLIDIARVASDLNDHETSILSTKRALRLTPEHPDALMTLAESLRQTERFDEALEIFSRLKRLAPHMPMLDHCMGVSYSGLGQYVEAEKHFRHALDTGDSRSFLTHWEFAHLLLRQGRWEEGWAGYARRFEAGPFSNVRRFDFNLPEWRGESLAGKKILIHPEQGLGDQIMFASIIPELIEEGAEIYLACSFELVDLFSDAFPTIPVYGLLRDADASRWIAALPPMDLQTPIGNLAVYRRPTEESFRKTAYLRSNALRVLRMKNYLNDVLPSWDDRGRYAVRVGLMWAANPALFDWRSARRGRKKTIPSPVLGRLRNVADTLFISLQTRQSAEQAAHVPRLDIIDCSQMLDTMADTAALMAELDVVVTVDTSVAHMAAALGKKTFVMLAHDSDWRWMLERKGSPWYSNIYLFRQPVDGDWETVIDQITVELQQMTPRGIPVTTVRGESKAPAATPASKKKERVRNA